MDQYIKDLSFENPMSPNLPPQRENPTVNLDVNSTYLDLKNDNHEVNLKIKSSAYGYAQAIDGTWDIYKKQAKKPFASRTSFKDSVDFIGWYNKKSNKLLGIPKDNARLLYLAYHEGRGGYKKGSYKSKPWLLSVSSDVQKMSNRYRNQYDSCKKKLKSPFYFLLN